MRIMKYAEFLIFSGKVIVSMPDEKSIEELIKGLKENFGIEVEEELRSLCG